jgi:hypothetical protein
MLERRFFAELVTPTSVPTTTQAQVWLMSNAPSSVLDTFQWLRLAQRFELSDRKIATVVSKLPSFLSQDAPTSLRALSLVSSALADAPASVQTRTALSAVFAAVPSGVHEDPLQVNRLCRAAVVHGVPSPAIGNLLSNLPKISDPNDLRWIFAYVAKFDQRTFPLILSALTRDAPLLSGRDLVGVMAIFAQISDFRAADIRSVVGALREVKIAVLRHVPTLGCSEISSLVHSLGLLGMWTHSSGGLIARHVDRILPNASRDHLARLLVGALGSRSDRKFLRANSVATIFNRCKHGDVSPLTAARVLWSVAAGNFATSEISVQLDGKWREPHAVAATKAKTHLLQVVDKFNPQTHSHAIGLENLSEYTQLLEEFSASESAGAISWLQSSDREFFGEFVEAGAEYPDVVMDVSRVPGFLRSRLNAKKGVKRKVVDPLSWVAKTEKEKKLFASGDKGGGDMFDTEAHSATALPKWNADDMKLPPQALKWSIRRANAHH